MSRALHAVKLIAWPFFEWGKIMGCFLLLLLAGGAVIGVGLAASYPIEWAWSTSLVQSAYHAREGWHVTAAVGLTVLLCRPPHH